MSSAIIKGVLMHGEAWQRIRSKPNLNNIEAARHIKAMERNVGVRKARNLALLGAINGFLWLSE